jgi:hypothetical protein
VLRCRILIHEELSVLKNDQSGRNVRKIQGSSQMWHARKEASHLACTGYLNTLRIMRDAHIDLACHHNKTSNATSSLCVLNFLALC